MIPDTDTVWADMTRTIRVQTVQDERLHRLNRRIHATILCAVLCLTTGLGLTVTPFIQQEWGEQAVERHAREVTETTATFPLASRQDQIRQAVDYNRRLYESGQPVIGEPVFDGKTAGGFQGDAEYQSQLSMNGLDAMGEILIPVIGVDMPIMHGAGQDVLEHAAGHLPGTSLPVGGPDTRSVITGHSNLKDATLFTRLGELKQGDIAYIRIMGHTLAYKVTGRHVISPDDTKTLRIQPGRDMLTLLTCTGPGNTMRLIVDAIRVDDPPTPEETQDRRTPIMLASGVAGGMLAIGLTPLILRRHQDPDGLHRKR